MPRFCLPLSFLTLDPLAAASEMPAHERSREERFLEEMPAGTGALTDHTLRPIAAVRPSLVRRVLLWAGVLAILGFTGAARVGTQGHGVWVAAAVNARMDSVSPGLNDIPAQHRDFALVLEHEYRRALTAKSRPASDHTFLIDPYNDMARRAAVSTLAKLKLPRQVD